MRVDPPLGRRMQTYPAAGEVVLNDSSSEPLPSVQSPCHSAAVSRVCPNYVRGNKLLSYIAFNCGTVRGYPNPPLLRSDAARH